MDASHPESAGAPDPEQNATGDGEIGLVSGAAAPLWATVLFAERLRAKSSSAAGGLLCGVGEGAFGRLSAAAFGAGPALEQAGVGFESVIDAQVAAAAISGAQRAATERGAPVFGVFFATATAAARGGVEALRRARAAGAPGGAIAVLVDDGNAGTEGEAAAALARFGAPVLHPATPSEAVAACVSALAGARDAEDWAAVAMPLAVAEATSNHGAAPDLLKRAGIVWPQDQRTHGGAGGRIGAVALGGGWAALDRAMTLLGLDNAGAEAMGFSVHRVMRTGPIDAAGLRAFAADKETLLIIEPSGALFQEAQSALYGETQAPQLERLAADDPRLAPEALAIGLARRLAALQDAPAARVEALLAEANALEERRSAVIAQAPDIAPRAAVDLAGWVGAARFAAERRRMIRLDSTELDRGGEDAIRAAAHARAPSTFLIRWRPAPLWLTPPRIEEDALAEPVIADDPTAPSRLAARLLASGVDRLGVLTDPERPIDRRLLPAAIDLEKNGDLEGLEARLAAEESVAAILDLRDYTGDESLRSFHIAPDATAVAINRAVCGGCADCELGTENPTERAALRRRGVEIVLGGEAAARAAGYCPAFVGASDARPRPLRAPTPPPATPGGFAPGRSQTVVGFAGAQDDVRAARILAAAARREGYAVGLWAAAEGAPHLGLVALCRIDAGASRESALAGPPTLGEIDHLVNCGAGHMPPAALFRSPEAVFAPSDRPSSLALGRLFFGSEAPSGLIALGAAFQTGALPVGEEALHDALASECRTTRARAEAALDLGRASAAPGGALDALTRTAPEPALEQVIEAKTENLVRYQNEAWSTRYSDAVSSAARAEKIIAPDQDDLARAVAEGFYALMSYADLYETARRISETTMSAIEKAFESEDGGPLRPIIYLPSAFFAGRDASGAPRKIGVGGWILPLMRLIKRGKVLRGGMFDLFGRSRLRRLERRMIQQYEEDLIAIGRGLSPARLPIAIDIARLPLEIRGFGAVKERAAAAAQIRRAQLWAAFHRAPGLGEAPAPACRSAPA